MQTTRLSTSRNKSGAAVLLLRIGFWVCIAIAVAVVIRRLIALTSATASAPPDMAALDQTFAGHAFLTLAHIVPALAFVLLTPVVLFRNAGWAERLLFPTGAIVGITAYGMSVYAVGGWVERSAVLVFNTIFMYSLWRAFEARREPDEKRRWLVRGIVVLLGIATTRPVMGMFFAASRVTHWKPSQFFGVAFWIGFSINLLVVELWLRRRKNDTLTASRTKRGSFPLEEN